MSRTTVKYTYEEVLEIFIIKGYILMDKIYKNNKQKLTFKDNEGFMYYCSLHSFMLYQPSKVEKSNPYTIQNIKLWLKLNNKPFELLSYTYSRNNIKLKWKCFIIGCEEVFEAMWNDMTNNRGCPYCAGRRVGLSNCLATKSPQLSLEWHPTRNNNLTPYNFTAFSIKRAWWQCSKNPKHEWEATIAGRNFNNSCCPYCAGKIPSEDYNLLVCHPEACEEWNYDKNDKLPEEYCPSSNKSVYWKCKECSHEWKSQVVSRTKLNGYNCPECSGSHGEIKIKKWLKKHDIDYIPQKEFDGLIGVGNGNLSYDFYLPQHNNLLIEYQGEFHDGKSNLFVKKFLKYQQEHDLRKKTYALSNGYELLEIWYWDFDNIESILEQYILEKNKNKELSLAL
ncbi:MAG TPA: zinc-ribbon domain-containing protein [Clostridium sp.]|uniref:zinc-ribbon domain-containing protein n=1 Tax=Clostridium sp. TaxID=1506 RepID=UPI002F941DE1